jgi:Domain of unknown function (DUF4410)
MRNVMLIAPAAGDVPDARGERCVRSSPMARALGLGLALALAGCAGAQVSDVAATHQADRPPGEILVEVSTAMETQPAGDVAAKLRSDLVQQLTKAGLAAEPFASGTNDPGAAVLHVSITEATPGSYLERLIIGFGLGRSQLQAKVALESAGGAAHPITAFDTSSASGRVMPGLVLPGAIAAASRNVMPLMIGGGLKLATSLRGSLDNSARQTAEAIVGEIKDYYASVGWRWPAHDRA